VTPEAKEHFDKARQCLTRARTILAAGIGEDAGRNAYLAAFHAAQALIAERPGGRVQPVGPFIHWGYSCRDIEVRALSDIHNYFQ
jgi:hypothetical protein